MDDTLRYQVELDTQGLSSQLASVRDVVAGGMSRAASDAGGAIDTVSGASNRVMSDLMMGQRMASAAMPSPSFMGDIFAGTGVSRAPVGMFPSQFQAMARQRLQERIQMGAVEGLSGFGTTALSMGIGAAIGGPAGAVVGLGVGILGDVAMQPVIGAVQEHMTHSAQIQQIFGFNKFSTDERTRLAGFMGQQFAKSIFSPEDFNNVLPAAVRAGFMRGVGRNDVTGFQTAFASAERTLQETMFTMQTDVAGAGQLFQGMRSMGVNRQAAAANMRRTRVLAQDMMELGEFVDPNDVHNEMMQIGAAAMQSGLSAQKAMDVFQTQTAMATRLQLNGGMDEGDLALLGGTTGAAGQRLSMSLMASQRNPIFRAMSLAFGSVKDGKAGIDQASIEALGAGKMSFSALSERLSQQFGTGQGGTTRMLTLMANQGKLNSDMLQNQGQMLRGMTDDILKQANLEMADGNRQFVMQRVFGIGEAESRALSAGLPMEKADRERIQKDAQQLDKEVKGAIQTANTGIARDFQLMFRELKDSLAEPMHSAAVSLSEKIAPSINKAVEHLASLDARVGGGPSTESPGRVPVMTGFGNTFGSMAR